MAGRPPDPLTMEHALLGLLRTTPQHGYGLYQEVRDPEGLWTIWRIKRSQLYALLHKLEDQALITATKQPQPNRPARYVYRLTASGHAAFEAWINQPVEHGRQVRLDFLAKLFFAQRDGPDAVQTLLDRQRATCRRWHAEQQTAADAATHPFQRLIHQYRLGQIDAMLDWLDTCDATMHPTPVSS